MASEPFGLSEALATLNNVANLQATYWNIYLASIIGAVAFIAAIWDRKKHPMVIVSICTSLVILFSSNLFAILHLQDRGGQLTAAIHAHVQANPSSMLPEFKPLLAKPIRVIDPLYIALVHIIGDIFVLTLVALSYRASQKPEGQSKPRRLVGRKNRQ